MRSVTIKQRKKIGDLTVVRFVAVATSAEGRGGSGGAEGEG